MTDRLVYVACVVALVWVAIVSVATAPSVPTTPPAFDFDRVRVERATTQELTDALCPPYSDLTIYEDGTYACRPG